jgi:hypothetical protein
VQRCSGISRNAAVPLMVDSKPLVSCEHQRQPLARWLERNVSGIIESTLLCKDVANMSIHIIRCTAACRNVG